MTDENRLIQFGIERCLRAVLPGVLEWITGALCGRQARLVDDCGWLTRETDG